MVRVGRLKDVAEQKLNSKETMTTFGPHVVSGAFFCTVGSRRRAPLSLVVGALRGSGDEAVVDNRCTPYSVTCRLLFLSPVSVVRCLHFLDLLKRAPLATSLAT